MNRIISVLIMALAAMGCAPEMPVLQSDSRIGIQTDNLDVSQQETILSAIDAWNEKTGYHMSGFLFSGDNLPTNAIVGMTSRTLTCAGSPAEGCTRADPNSGTIVTRLGAGFSGEDLLILMTHEIGHMLGADDLDRGVMCMNNHSEHEIDDTVLHKLNFTHTVREGHSGKLCSNL